MSGVRGWKNKRQRREEDGQDIYRNAASSLSSRYKKKLTARTSWYKNTNKNGKREYVLDEEEEEDMRRRNAAKRAKKPREEPGQEETEKIDKNTNLETTDKNKNKAVLFVPYTVGSILAKRLREAEENLLHSTGYKLKIVERSGSKLEGQECGRQDCMLCSTKNYTGKNKTQECSKRSLVYQTYCITCKERDIEKIKIRGLNDKKKQEEEIKNMRLHKYIGETSRSCYERSQEHLNDMHQLKPSSHMLRHALDQHEGEPLARVRFGMEIIKQTRTSFERQILESVIMSTRLGEKEYKKYE